MRTASRHWQADGHRPTTHLAKLDQPALDRLWNRYPGFEDVYPLTPMQRLFFVMDASRPEVGFEQWQFRIEGQIVPAQLRKAFEAVIARHTILRTAFPALGTDELFQVVLPRLSCHGLRRTGEPSATPNKTNFFRSCLPPMRRLGSISASRRSCA